MLVWRSKILVLLADDFKHFVSAQKKNDLLINKLNVKLETTVSKKKFNALTFALS